MIERLTVDKFILVEHLELTFTAGFNVLSGETGAGKSILVGALSILFGGKGGPDLVRSGADEALVAGEFRVSGNDAAASWLSEHDIAPDDGVILIRRTLRTSGRGTIYVQSTPVTRADLEELAGLMLDLHSQHEHQSLFVETQHRRILDRYAGLEERVRSFGELFRSLSEKQQRLRELESREQDREREIEILQFAVDEIAAVDPQDGELDALENERHRLNDFEKLAGHVEATTELLEGSEYAVVPLIKRLRHELGAAARTDGELSNDAARVENAYFELEDVAQNIAAYRDRLTFDPARLETVEERIVLLRKLFRKYGETAAEVHAYAARAQGELEQLRSLNESRGDLKQNIAELEQQISREARALHEQREAAARALSDAIQDVLADLAMGRAHFVVQVESKSNDAGRLVCGPHGADFVRFLISTNEGEDARPLSRVASGGEISRVMLAIKTVIAGSDEVRTLVFDEIDSGIGGQVALSIAAHLHTLSQSSQVICITHLATIAVRADNHMVVEKESRDGHTRIRVTSVAGEERVREIARMLAGDVDGALSVEHARSLLDRYQRVGHGENQY